MRFGELGSWSRALRSLIRPLAWSTSAPSTNPESLATRTGRVSMCTERLKAGCASDNV